MITTGCPKPTYMASAVTSLNPCPSEFGQIQKLIFWRRGNKIASIATALIATTWTTLLTATGNTKALVAGFVVGKVTPGEARESGGGNESIDGIATVVGVNPSVAEFQLIQRDQDEIKALKKLASEALDVLFINENGAIGYLDQQYNGTGTGVYGIPVAGLSITDLEFGDFDGRDQNKLKFSMPANWSDNFEKSADTAFALTLVNS
jgi:hypothetical protein